MIILVGKSASGKTYIGKLLEKQGYHKIVTYTTREKRIGEQNKIDYNFITKDEFLTKIEQDFFYEYVIYNNNYYGTSKDSTKDIKSYLIVEVKGLTKYLGNKNVVSFYIDCPKETLKARMLNRKDKIEDINIRLTKDEEVFKDVPKLVDFVIDGNKNVKLILKEIEEKYYGRLKMAINS